MTPRVVRIRYADGMAPEARGTIHRIEVVEQATAEIMRGMTGAEKLRLAWRLHDSARSMLTASLRQRHPEWTAQDVQAEVIRRIAHDAG